MTAKEKKRLLKQIAQAAELAYRRGFQHGHCAGRGDWGTPPTPEAVASWRFSKGAERECKAPPGSTLRGLRTGLIDRLLMELFTRHNLIRALAAEVRESNP